MYSIDNAKKSKKDLTLLRQCATVMKEAARSDLIKRQREDKDYGYE